MWTDADGRKDMAKLISACGDYAKTLAISDLTKICTVGVELIYVDRQTDGQTDGRTDRRTDGRTDGRKDRSLRHPSLSWASPIQSIYPHPTSWRSVLILSTNLRLGLPSGLFPSGFPTRTLYTTLSSPIRTTCPPHLILLDFITRAILDEGYRSFSSSLCFIHLTFIQH